MRRAIVLRDTDIRLVCATGRLGRPSSYEDFSPGLNTAEQWTPVPADSGQPILVSDPKRACLVVFNPLFGVTDRIDDQLPAVAIEKILFSSDAAMRQWSARSKTMEGLPSPLPAVLAVLPSGCFETSPPVDSPRWRAPQFHSDESDRVAGALVGALVQGGVSRKSWDRLLDFRSPARSDLADLWWLEHQVEPEAISAVLAVLSDQAWGVGFDPTQMLDQLHSALTLHYDATDLEAWRTYVGGILANHEVARPDGLRDAGKTLLRALELFLRTPQPSIARIAHEIRIRSGGGREEVGSHVGRQALAMAGWFEGFAATGSIIKGEPGLYGVGCRVSANSRQFPLKFEERIERCRNYGRLHLLVESGHTLGELRKEPPPLLLKALHSAEEICSDAAWSCSFDEELHAICVRHSDWEVRATLVDRGVLCWQCEVQLPKGSKQRTWPRGFIDWAFIGNARWSCSVGSTEGFPKVAIRHHAWLRTLDDEEVRFAINSILQTRDDILAWQTNSVGVDGSPAT
jgi:hypothetical protein